MSCWEAVGEVLRLYRLLYLLGAVSKRDYGLVDRLIDACTAGSIDPGVQAYKVGLEHRLFMVIIGYLSVVLGLFILTVLLYRIGVHRLLYNYSWYIVHRNDYIVQRRRASPRGVGAGYVAAAVVLGVLLAYIGGVYMGYMYGFETLVGRIIGDNLVILIGNHWGRANIFRVVVSADGMRIYSGVFLIDPYETYLLNISLNGYIHSTNSTKIHVYVKLYVFDDRRSGFIATGDELSLVAP